MKRFSRSAGMIVLSLVVFSLLFPDPSLARRGHPSKKAEAVHAPKKAKAEEPSQTASASQPTSSALQCDAQSAVLMDGLTGEILYEQNARSRIAPASFVKVMTLYLIYDAIRAGQMKTDDLVTVSETAWRRAYKTDSSKMFIKVGDRVKVDDLI